MLGSGIYLELGRFIEILQETVDIQVFDRLTADQFSLQEEDVHPGLGDLGVLADDVPHRPGPDLGQLAGGEAPHLVPAQ